MSMRPKRDPSVSVAGTNIANQTVTVPFVFVEDNDLIVTKTISGVTTTLTLGSGYTVADNSQEGIEAPGSVVTIISAVPTTGTITIATSYSTDEENDAMQRFDDEGSPVDGPLARDPFVPTGIQFSAKRKMNVRAKASISNPSATY